MYIEKNYQQFHRKYRFNKIVFLYLLEVISNMSLDFDKLISESIDGEVLFSFQGELSSSQVTELLEVIEKRLDSVDAENKVKKRVYYVAVESIQNLFHHAISVHMNGDINREIRLCAIVLSKSSDFFSITTGNFVYQEKISEIARHIDDINRFSKEELKDYYKQILTNQEFSDKGGGGLGMIDIARKAEGKFQYQFENYKNNTVFFKLQININQN